MATNRVLQLLRSNQIYANFTAAKTAIEGLKDHKDGEILLARYISSAEGVTPATYETAIGVYAGSVGSENTVAVNHWTVFKSSTELDAAIQALRNELDATQTGAGLGNDGSYTAPASGEDGYDVIGTATSLNDAINKIAKAIEDMDYSNNYTAASGTEPNVTPAHATDASKVISGISQVDGQVDAVTTDAVDLLLTGYANDGRNSGNIAATDTLEDALNKLENATTTGVQVSARTGNQITRVTGDETAANNGLYSHVEIAQLTEQEVTALSNSNVREAYKLINPTDRTAIGDVIKIYKDSALQLVYLGTKNDTINTTTGEITEDSTITDKQSLNFKYLLADGTYSLVKLDVSKFLTESEFGDGLDVSSTGVVSVKAGDGLVFNATSKAVDVNPGNGIEISSDAVAVKIDTTSEKDTQATPADFLTVGANGVKVQGIKDEIDRKIAALDGTADANGQSTTPTTPTADFKVLTKVVETDGAIDAASTEAVNLKKVAATGAAEDVTIADSGNLITATTVEGALQEIAQNVNNNQVVSNDVIVATPDTTNHNTKLSVTIGTGLTKEGTNRDTLNVALSPQAASTAADAAYAGGNDTSNILQIKNDGLYLDSTWDCGVY